MSYSIITHLMKKYPRTFHFMFSPEIHSDDKVISFKFLGNFLGREVIITEKLDGANCVDGDTILNTSEGEKTIREIHETNYRGLVESYNTFTGEIEFRQILNSFITTGDDDWYELEDTEGNCLKVTDSHLVYLPELNCYRKVVDLKEGDKVLLKMSNIVTIKRITKLTEKREKFDITVEHNHNFFANNILVHNSCLKGHEGVFGRSHALPTIEPWYDHLKGVYYSRLSNLKPNLWIFGENTYAIHSIEYTEMEHYFYIFAIYDTDTDTWLSYDEMVAEAKRIDIPTVPLLFRGTVVSMAWVNKWMDKYMKGKFSLLGGDLEGFVLRVADAIPGDKFQEFVAKYVRKGHVQSDKHWKQNWKPQKLKSSSDGNQ